MLRLSCSKDASIGLPELYGLPQLPGRSATHRVCMALELTVDTLAPVGVTVHLYCCIEYVFSSRSLLWLALNVSIMRSMNSCVMLEQFDCCYLLATA